MAAAENQQDFLKLLKNMILQKENKMTMPEELKGYKCPDKECYECEFLKTKCIVYSAEGKKKYEQWQKEQNKENNK